MPKMAFSNSQVGKPYWQIEDEDLEVDEGEFEIQWEDSFKEDFRSARHLLVANGVHAISYFQECQSKQVAATILIKKELASDDFAMGLRARKLKPALLYKLGSSDANTIWLLVNSPDLPRHLYYQLALDLVIPENPQFSVLVFTTAPLVEYVTKLSEDELEDPLPRCLKTDPWSLVTPLLFPLLEAPNLIAGLSAAFINRCQCEKLPALLAIVYTQNRNADSRVSQVFQKLVQSIPALSKILWPASVKPRHEDPTGNMYV